jgi:hypothetical protein
MSEGAPRASRAYITCAVLVAWPIAARLGRLLA